MKMINVVKLLVFFIAFFICLKPGNAQLSGSRFMPENNFYSQLINPAVFNDSRGIVLAVPGFAGFAVMNTGNFRLSDVVEPVTPDKYSLEFDRLAYTGNKTARMGQTVMLPLVFVSVPVVDGTIHFYWNEYIETGISAPADAHFWVMNDNASPEYRNFYMDIGLKAYWNHEIAAGMSIRAGKKLKVGGRVKLLFNEVFAELNNWNYTMKTHANGDEVLLSSQGQAYISAPVVLGKDRSGLVHGIELQEVMAESLLKFQNPGVAFDFGLTSEINNFSSFDISIRNLGIIWLRKNTFSLFQDKDFRYSGMDISNSLDAGDENYVSTLDVMLNTKRNFKNVFRPSLDSVKTVRGLSPKLNVSYKYRISDSFSAGVGNQTDLNKSFIRNTLSLGALYTMKRLELSSSLSLHNTESFSVGGGVQWNNAFSQLFLFTDNFSALYYPASQKSFSVTFGMNLLLEQNRKWDIFNKSTNRRGKNQTTLPFYEGQ
ncbi:MAG: DUF5723 family protein [Prolixibacteraceae bacterium]